MQTTSDLSALFVNNDNPWDVQTLLALKEAAFSTKELFDRFVQLVRESERAGGGEVQALKLGISLLWLGCASDAARWLEQAGAEPQRDFYLAQALRDQGKYAEAARRFESAGGEGIDKVEAECARAECLLRTGDLDAAEQVLSAQKSAGQGSAHWHYVEGRLLQERGEVEAAGASYEKALELDEDHPYAMFHMAYLLDLHGNEDRSLELYYRCTELPYVYSHALINLAISHEDRCDYDKAASCLRRVLVVNPNHERARLYLKDVLAANEMYIDDQQVKAREKRDAVMDIPVSDFELSVRSRNCLKKMNINTLGDLLKTTEPELLAYKNFGETSLREIKAMLAQKGLTLGQNSHLKAPPAPPPAPTFAPPPGVSAEVFTRPVSTLELSVRSRKCLQRLGITTIGELTSQSEPDLLESRNFGATSLKEIKARLAELNLSLRQSS